MSGSAPTNWSISDLGAFYQRNRSEIHAHAMRLLKDSSRADEVVQDVFLKFVLAAPEIDSEEWAISYLHRSVENQVKDIYRAEGRRPHLVVLDDAQVEVEAKWATNDPDVADAMEAADDAAIIRQALALLPAAQRQALVMWEIEEASTEEIAAALGIEEKNVRHAVSRARTNFRRILTEWVIDEEQGLTALDLLSSTYKRAAAQAKNAGKIALSLVILLAAFLGFNSLTSSDVVSPVKVTKVLAAPSTSAVPVLTSPVKPSSAADASSDLVIPSAVPTPDATVATVDYMAEITARQVQIDATLAKIVPASWPGLDASGMPVGFTVTDGGALSGTAVINQDFPVLTSAGTVVSESEFMTSAGATNILLHQKVIYNGVDLSYEVHANVRIGGVWKELPIASRVKQFTTLADGTRLITTWLMTDSTQVLEKGVSGPAYGSDAVRIPSAITIRLHTSNTGQPVYGQAVQILDPLKVGA